ncbi:unnamed protein product [Eruca vesicaria subsp. sativa]|uniref:TFIIF beta subunit HTH domain-containing protein n=1 Tax=Eruca vesicaria subsp. sativa TaxID=29727 RepID=A0ABC8LPE9_ERUVS|nr:unnamed protein product [Eruca vesicaria subsp. sativa]
MGKPEMQKKKIQRKKLREGEKILAEELERLSELSVEEYQELETEKADEMVLLMKCPPRVDKAWRQLSSSSSSFSHELVLLAKYKESVDLLRPILSHELSMEMVSAELCNISKLYSVNKSKDFVGPVSLFSESNQGKLAVEGTVTHKLDMRPHDCIEEYGKLLRERNMKPVVEYRHVQVLDDCRGEHMTPKPALVTKKLKREKRTRSDRSEVEAKMFKLFEREPKWTLRQLVKITNQPESFLKEILKELCVYNARSGYTYELKPEYKKCS